MKKQTQYLNILLAAMIVWVPNQLHLPADLGVKGLNSINLLFLAIIYYVHQRNKKLPPSEATPLKGVFIAYFCMLVWGFLAGQLTDRSLMMEDLTAMKNSIFFMCLYFVFFHGARDETSVRHLFYVVLFVAAVAGIEAIREGIDYGFGVYGETKRAAGPFGSNYKASNLAAVFFSMFMPVFAAVALYQKGRPTVRMGAIAGVVILLLGIFCTYSRQAYLIVAAMLLLMTLKRNVLLGILILVAVVNYQAWVPEGVVTRLAMTEQTSEETGEEQLDESTESRFILWPAADVAPLGHRTEPLQARDRLRRALAGRSGRPQLPGADHHRSRPVRRHHDPDPVCVPGYPRLALLETGPNTRPAGHGSRLCRRHHRRHAGQPVRQPAAGRCRHRQLLDPGRPVGPLLAAPEERHP